MTRLNRTYSGVDAPTPGGPPRTAWHTAQCTGPRSLVILASWLVSLAYRLRQRGPTPGHDVEVYPHFDALLIIRAQLWAYLGSARRWS